MAIPASGCIGIITCPNSVACTSIAQAVDGNVTPPKSLSTLSTTAGKSAPHSMTEFYNYSSSKAVYFGTISSIGTNGVDIYVCACSCLQAAGGMTAGDCFNAAFQWWINKGAEIGPNAQTVGLICNGSIICSCTVSVKGAANCTGTFASRCYDSNDTIHVVTEAEIFTDTTIPGEAYVTLCALTNVVGTYHIGNPDTVSSYTCGLA